MKCRWNQWRISNSFDDGKPLPSSVQKHLLACPQCREFYKRSLQIERALSESALTETDLTPQPLAGRFFDAAMHASHSELPGKPRSRWIPLASAALFLAAASVLVPLLRDLGPATNPAFANNPVSAFESLVLEARPVVIPLPAGPVPWRSYVSQSYQKELNLLARDTDTAVKFVASCAGLDLSGRTIIPQPNF